LFGLNREIQHHVQEHHFELEKLNSEEIKYVLSERSQACFEKNPHLDPSELNLSKHPFCATFENISGNTSTFTVPSRKNP